MNVCSFFRMTQPKAINFLELPYEIHALIFKHTLLQDAKALARTCQKMYTTYNEINKCLADKISFNSKYDDFKKVTHLTCLKEIILDYFPSDASYDECIELCLRQKSIERIILFGLIYDGITTTRIFKYPVMKYLTELELKFLTAPYAGDDYLLPFVQNTTTLQKIKLENIILNAETMDYLAKNENMKCIKFQNVFIYDIVHFRLMLSKLKRMKTFFYFFFQFTHLTNMVKTIEAIFEYYPQMPMLRDLKISIWQDMNIRQIQETITYKRQYHTFKVRGNAAPLFRAIIPLVNPFILTEFELFYFNKYFGLDEFKRASMKYNITDEETQIIKLHEYTTE